MAAKTTPFEEAKDQPRQVPRQLEPAKKQITDDTAHIEDLIAGGATLEEIASETVMELGTIALNSESQRRPRRRPEVPRRRRQGRDRARRPTSSSSPAAASPRCGVDKIDPPAVIPLAEIRDRVAADWTAAQTADALSRLAEGYIDELKGGTRLRRPRRSASDRPVTAGRAAHPRRDRPRRAARARRRHLRRRRTAPRVTGRDGDSVILAELTAIEPFDPKARRERPDPRHQVRDQFRQQARDDVLALYTAALRDAAGVTVNQALIDSDPRALPVTAMQLFPAIEDFTAGFGAGRNQVVWTRLAADLDTPVSLMLKLDRGAHGTRFMLESVTGGEVRGRYSIIGMNPDLVWECRGTTARLNRAARFDADAFEPTSRPPAGQRCAR